LLEDVSAAAVAGSVLMLQFMEAATNTPADVAANALSAEEATRELTKHGWAGLQFSRFGDESLSFGRYPERFEPSVSFSFCVCRKA
jgi:hypothetical protein